MNCVSGSSCKMKYLNISLIMTETPAAGIQPTFHSIALKCFHHISFQGLRGWFRHEEPGERGWRWPRDSRVQGSLVVRAALASASHCTPNPSRPLECWRRSERLFDTSWGKRVTRAMPEVLPWLGVQQLACLGKGDCRFPCAPLQPLMQGAI